MAALPGLHPGDHDPAAVRRQQRLRRIEVEAVIDRVDRLSGKLPVLAVKASDQIDIAETVVVGASAGEHLLRGCDQDRVIVHHKEIRTLPHPAVFVPAAVQNRKHLPVHGVCAAVEKDGAAPVHGAVGDDRIIAVILLIPPDLGIAEIHCAPAFRQIRRSQDRVVFIFFIVDAVAESHTLHLAALNISVLALALLHTGIHQKLTAVRHLHCASGEASRIVVFLVRGDRSRQPLPAHQILCLHMSPVHGPPDRVVGIVLIKEMIFTLIDRKTVGVIHPADTRHHMKKRPIPLQDPVSVNLLILPRLLQFRIHKLLPSRKVRAVFHYSYF